VVAMAATTRSLVSRLKAYASVETRPEFLAGLIDAVDDYDKDLKKKAYNPFRLAYGAACKRELVEKNSADLQFLFGTLFSDIQEKLQATEMGFNRDLIDNVLLRGLPAETCRVLSDGCCNGCDNKKNKKRKSKER
jgi:hypothetical protein